MNSSIAATNSDIAAELSTVGRNLEAAFSALLAPVPGRHEGPTRLAKELQIDRILAQRVLAALNKKDPLATAHAMPGPGPLERVINAAERHGATPEAVSATVQAVRDFERLIREHGGDRGGLDAIIAASLPEVRGAYETVAKQWMYRGARQLKGIDVEVQAHTYLFHPGSDPDRHDVVSIRSYLGLRRVRPNASMNIGVHSQVSAPLPGHTPPRTLDDRPITDPNDLLLHEFCSGPSVKLALRHSGNDVHFLLDWQNAVGHGSSRDVVLAELRRNLYRRRAGKDDPRTKAGIVDGLVIPAKVFYCDILLHEDVYPGAEPKLRILELGEHGFAEVNDESRDVDVLDVSEQITPLGRGVDNFRAADVPKYVELLHHACATLGWDPQKFLGRRTRVQFPMYGTQIQIAFDLPRS